MFIYFYQLIEFFEENYSCQIAIVSPFDCYKSYLAFKNHFCKESYDYFKYNGVHEVISDFREIKIFIKVEDEKKYYQGIKLGYNVSYRDFSKLVEVKKKKNLPMPLKEM